MTRSINAAATLLVAVLLVSGCSKPPPPIVPAGGVILLNGQPLPNAYVQFVPTAEGVGSDYIATGTSDEKGHFELTCKGQPGAAACATMVLVIDAPVPGEVRGNQSAEAKNAASQKNRP